MQTKSIYLNEKWRKLLYRNLIQSVIIYKNINVEKIYLKASSYIPSVGDENFSEIIIFYNEKLAEE